MNASAEMLIGLTMVMLPYLVLICVAAQVCAILQALEHFTWPALLPVILNVVWLGLLMFVVPRSHTAENQIYVIAAGIVFAGVLQLLAPLPQLQALGYRYTLGWSHAATDVRLILATLVPVLIGLSITQLNTIADSVIAWCFAQPENGPDHMDWFWGYRYPLQSGSAAALYFGQRMYQFPLGVFGVALGTVLFPRFSKHAANQELANLQSDLLLGLKLIVGIGLPASLGLILIAHHLTALLFQHGAFNAQDAYQTAQMISAYAIAVWAYCGLLIVHRAYYALDDQQTPLRVGLGIVVLNLLLNFSLIWFMGAAGLAFATAMCAIVQLMVILTLLEARVGPLLSRELFHFLFKAAIATVIMYLAGWFTLDVIPARGGSLLHKLLRVFGPVSFCSLLYFVSAQLLGMRELSQLWQRETHSDSDG